ncbi:MAG: TolC family protein [Ignavibacteria bacterium]|nr:TolC family protein [Ignavibacteria bacterium]
MVAGLIQRKLPSFSLLGRLEVERGIFASAGPAFNITRLARRVGLYVQRILHGEEAGKLSVRFPRREQLTINMATARAINVFPNWRVLEQADLLNEELEDVDRKLSLASAVREAIAENLDLAAASKEVAAGAENVGLARSTLLPQLDISAQGVVIDKDRAEASFGSQAEGTISGSATLSQVLYSEPAWANLSIQEDLQSALEQEREQLRLDITLDAATAYLNVLRAKTFQRIQKDNLNLTRSNLDLAQLRVAIGSAGRQEVFRWESEVASSRIDVIAANAQRDQAEIALNQLLHRPLEEPFITAEAGLEDSALLTSDQRLFTYTGNPWYFEVFRDFMVQEGVAASPELKQLDAAIAAQERALTSANNAFWAPTIALQGDVTNIFSRSGAGSSGSTFTLPPPLPSLSFPTADDLNWNVALRLSLPIFNGAERFVARTQAREALAQLRLEREATEERIEQRIRTAIHQAGVSYPAIRWSRAADTASHKNLELVTDAYSRGAVDIIRLIDAQNAALIASLAEENAVYDFLIDFMNIQRTVGTFDIFMSKEEREAWFGRLESYFEKVGASPGRR